MNVHFAKHCVLISSSYFKQTFNFTMQKYKGIYGVGTGLFFNTKVGSLTVETYTRGAGGVLTTYDHKTTGDLHFERYAQKVIAFWKRRLN